MTAQLEAGREEHIREIRRELSSLFDGMMQTLYKLEGSQLRIEVLETPRMREFTEAHAAALDSSFQKVEMTDTMRRRLQRSDYVFSGMKTFHELNEAFPSLLDENGERKPFERFLNDVRKIDETYNSNYLRAEYNFVQASAEMAAKWERFIRDGDRYYLQYRTASDDKVRPEHAELHGITLPPGDPFWEEYFPPNGWNCRCDVVQVRKSKYPATPADEARRRAESVFGDGKGEMFRFNPGKQEKAVPDYNPYTIRQCGSCDLAKKTELAKKIPENELCAACRIVREMARADARTTRHKAKALQGTTVTNPDFPHKIQVTRKSINEWTNQPFKFFEAKNRMLLDIASVLGKAKYLGTADNHKGIPRVVQSHIFETEVHGEKALVIVREYDWGEFVLHSISDSRELYSHIKKK